MPDDWFVGFQVGLKAKFWRAASEPWADDDAAAIHGLLDLPAGARVLDAPCGAGRIAVRLAERGLDVTGVDISAEEIEEARGKASRARFEVGDLRALPAGVLRCRRLLGQQLRIHAATTATVAHIESTRRALREGGRLILESATVAESLLAKLRAGDRLRGGRRDDARAQRVRRRARPDGRRFQFEDERRATASGTAVIHHVHTVGEVVRMLQGAGFHVDELLADTANARRMRSGRGTWWQLPQPHRI